MTSTPPEHFTIALHEHDIKTVFLPEQDLQRSTWQARLAAHLRVKNEYVRLFLAEFIGTFMLVSIGVGSVAQAVLSKGADGNVVTIAIGWGMAVATGVYASGGVSGGHINPAVTTAMALLGRLPWRKVPVYYLGQYAGAIFGSLAVYVVYLDSLWNYAHEQRLTPSDVEDRAQSAGIWATYPKPHVSTEEGFIDQIFATSLLVIIALSVLDERNMAAPKGMAPLVIGLGVTSLVCAFVFNCGAALNPARDLGPRIFTSIAGWKAGPFSYRDGNWFWVPILGPHVGAILGALFYNICVGLHWPIQQH